MWIRMHPSLPSDRKKYRGIFQEWVATFDAFLVNFDWSGAEHIPDMAKKTQFLTELCRFCKMRIGRTGCNFSSKTLHKMQRSKSPLLVDIDFPYNLRHQINCQNLKRTTLLGWVRFWRHQFDEIFSFRELLIRIRNRSGLLSIHPKPNCWFTICGLHPWNVFIEVLIWKEMMRFEDLLASMEKVQAPTRLKTPIASCSKFIFVACPQCSKHAFFQYLDSFSRNGLGVQIPLHPHKGVIGCLGCALMLIFFSWNLHFKKYPTCSKWHVYKTPNWYFGFL